MNESVTKYRTNIIKTVDHYMHDAPWWMRLEMRQWVYVILLEYDTEKYADAESKGLIPALISRIVRNQWCSISSEFHRKWRRTRDVDDFFWESMPAEEPEDLKDDTFLRIKEIVAGLPPKLKEAILLYAEYGNFVEPAELLGVYPTTVRDRVIKVRKIVKRRLEGSDTSKSQKPR